MQLERALLIRHNTVLYKPMISYQHDGNTINADQMKEFFGGFVKFGKKVTAAAYADLGEKEFTKYNPVGYVLSANKDAEDQKMDKRAETVRLRYESLRAEAEERLVPQA